VKWTFNDTDKPFSIELANDNIHSGLLAQGPIAVQNNIQPNTGSVSFELPDLPPASDYYLNFVAVNDVNDVYATSPKFPISDNPLTTTTSSHVSTSKSGSTPGNQTQTGTQTASNTGGQTTLVLSTSSSNSAGSPTSTSKKGAAMASFGVNLDGIIYAMFVVFGAMAGGAL